MFQHFHERDQRLEHLDTGDYTAEEFEGCLIELRRINRWLGDSGALRRTLLAEIVSSGLRNFSVLDVGAGSGELLRVIARWIVNKECQVGLVGLELNARSARAILDESRAHRMVLSVQGDGRQLPFVDNQFDYVICSLFTHHFSNEMTVGILREMGRVARRRIFVIDLHRHPIAYYLYKTLGRLFLYNRLIREDGALSILRSFKTDELKLLAGRADLDDVEVERRFPFRVVLSARPGAPATSAARLRTKRHLKQWTAAPG
ncbi:MAG TPA: methyltransferase domain-containing protein [Pyrinomonadaceae bacterium]|nr:methyltransferase domain-containing protein [Pyrinomonadaceae bacterium]